MRSPVQPCRLEVKYKDLMLVGKEYNSSVRTRVLGVSRGQRMSVVKSDSRSFSGR